MCKCNRVIEVYMKHNDLSSVSIPHLKFSTDGYLPDFGILGGSQTDLTICMDCGKIQGWIPISDSDIIRSELYAIKEELDSLTKEEDKAKKSGSFGPAVISPTTIEKAYIEQVLKDQFGNDWATNPEVKSILEGELTTSTGKTLAAVKMILDSLS